MINVTKEQRGSNQVIKFAGSIEESVNFEGLVGATPQEIQVSTREVSRINSVGVKSWIKYFQSLTQKGVKVTLIECSTAIVEQINLISNFTGGARVESIYVPFSCQKCKGELVGLFKTEDLKKMGMNIPEVKCTKCADGKAVFDDIAEEYFGFLER